MRSLLKLWGNRNLLIYLAMIRFLTILGCLSALFCTGCTSIRRGDPVAYTQNPCREPVEVIMVHGLGGYWPGSTRQADRLQEKGFQTCQIIGMANADLKVREIIREYESGQRRSPIVLVGYSVGANWAHWMSEQLDYAGCPVHSMVLLDPTYDVDIPCNVQHCLNLYTARPETDWIPAFRGIPATSCCGNTFNCELRSTFPGKFPNSHFSICANDLIHRVIAKHLEQRVHGPCCAESYSEFEEPMYGQSTADSAVLQTAFSSQTARKPQVRQELKKHSIW